LTPASGAEKIFTNHLGLLDYTTSVETYNSVTQNSPNCNLLELRQAVRRSCHCTVPEEGRGKRNGAKIIKKEL